MPLAANLPERYEPVRLLGSGGMGSVFEVYDRVLERHVALKVLARVEPVHLYRFKQEFRALADVSHDNLVTLHELSFDAGTWFFTMELVRGSTFLPYVRPGTAVARLPPDRTGMRAQVSELPTLAERGPRTVHTGALSVERLRDALAQLCEGLQQLHALGFAHRDVKPSNILVDGSGRIVLCDFGLVAETHAPGLATHIERGLVAGTLSYMAPEQMLGQPATPACDWYAVGVLLFQALTARLPFEGDREALIEWKQLGPTPAPREIDPHVPRDLDELCVALMSSTPEARGEAASRLRRDARTRDEAGSSVRLAPRLVGRETELGALIECRSRAASTCLVIGAPGLGKSRLLHEFAERSRRAGDLVLASRCREREQVPFNALDGIIDELSGWLTTLPAEALVDLLPSSAALLARLFPLFAPHVISPEASAPSDPVEQRLAAAKSLRELLSSVARRRRVAVIIDDAHRMDRDSESLLADLIRPPDPPHILLVCSALEVPPVFRASGIAPRIVELPPLTREQSEMLAAELFDARAPSKAFLSEAAAAAHGLPRRLVELAEATLPVEEGTTLGVRLVSAKLAELPASARDLLAVLAFARVPLSTPIALRASGVPLEAVAQLRSRHLIRLDGPFSEGLIEIEDSSVAEASRNHPDPDAAREIHERLALALDGGKHFEALAFHWDAAGRRDRALHHAILAADRAAEQLAFDHAATWYRTALGWAPDGARHSLRVALGEALANAGRGKAAADAFLEAARDAPDKSFELRRRAARQLLISGHTHDGLALVSQLCHAIGVDVPNTRVGSVARLLTKRVRIGFRNLRGRHKVSAPNRDLARAVDVCWEASMGTSVVDPVRAAFFQAVQLELALSAGDDWRTARAYALEAGLRSVRGTRTLGAGERWLERARALAPEADPDLGGLIPLSAGVVAYLEGRFLDSVALCAQAERHFLRNVIGATWEIDTAASFGSWSSFYAGRVAELREQTIVRFHDADARGNLYAKSNLASVLALSRIMADEADLARRELDDLDGKWVTRGLNVQHYNTMLGFVVIALYRADAEEALARMLECFLGLRRAFLLGVEPLRIVGNYFLGTAALAAVSHGSEETRRERVAIARRAERRLSREHAEYGRAFGHLLRAGLAMEARDPTLARHELRSAQDGFGNQGMRLFERVAESRRLELAGVPKSAEHDANAAWFVSEGIVAPSRLVAVFAPFPE